MSIKLTDGEKAHPLWIKIETHLKERLQLLRSKNDGALDALQTATIRGQIAEAKALINLGREQKIQE